MAFIEGSSDGLLDGTTETTLVAAPGAGVRRLIKTMQVYNQDTARVEVRISVKNGVNLRTIWKGHLDPGDTWIFGDAGDVAILDSTSKSVVAVMTLPAATLNPDFVTAYGDVN